MPVLAGTADLSLFCPQCGNEILKSRAGTLKMRTKLLIRDPEGSVRGICRSCGAEMPLPLEIALGPLKEPRLYVRPGPRRTDAGEQGK